EPTVAVAGTEWTHPEYWVRHVRETVRFADGVRALGAAGVDTFVELGPRSMLLGLVPECLGGNEATLIASLRAERSEAVSILCALGAYFARGKGVKWTGVFPEGGRRVQLPTYAWQRERYWIESRPSQARAGEPTGHPLLGVRLSQAGAEARYES